MPRNYSMDTRAAATDAVRHRILEAALDELVAAPSGSLTLQAVAARADLAVRTLYNHFPHREALLTAAFIDHTALSRAAVAAASVPHAHPAQQLQYLVEAYYTRYRDMGPRLTALLAVRELPALTTQIIEIRTWRHEVLTQVIHTAHQAGLLTTTEPVAVALTFTATSHAYWHMLTTELDTTTAPTITTNALLAAILDNHP